MNIPLTVLWVAAVSGCQKAPKPRPAESEEVSASNWETPRGPVRSVSEIREWLVREYADLDASFRACGAHLDSRKVDYIASVEPTISHDGNDLKVTWMPPQGVESSVRSCVEDLVASIPGPRIAASEPPRRFQIAVHIPVPVDGRVHTDPIRSHSPQRGALSRASVPPESGEVTTMPMVTDVAAPANLTDWLRSLGLTLPVHYPTRKVELAAQDPAFPSIRTGPVGMNILRGDQPLTVAMSVIVSRDAAGEPETGFYLYNLIDKVRWTEVHDGLLVVSGDTSAGPTLFAMDTARGTVRWNARGLCTTEVFDVNANGIVCGSTVPSPEGNTPHELLLLDLTTGAKLARAPLPSEPIYVAAVGEYVHVLTRDRSVSFTH